MPTRSDSPSGILGAFFVMLGTGLVLDADWLLRGLAVIAVGISCFLFDGRRSARDHRTPA
jgi:hypothetical protein